MFKPIENLTKILLILLLPCSSAAFSEISAKYYKIQIGNHSTLEVKFLDADFHTMSAHLQSPNGNNREILFDADRKEITLTDNSIPSTWHSDQTDVYNVTLRELRDLIAYAAGPERYDWLVFGPSILNPELNEAILFIDKQLSNDPSLNINCQVLSEHQELHKWAMSGGVFGDLGRFSAAIDSIWVRDGYELVLSTGLDFTVDGIAIAHARGKDTREITELTEIEAPSIFAENVDTKLGTAYTLKDSALAGAVHSLICRPVFP